MELKIDRDQDKCLGCMFLDADLGGYEGKCILFSRDLLSMAIFEDHEYWKPCNECNLVWENARQSREQTEIYD